MQKKEKMKCSHCSRELCLLTPNARFTYKLKKLQLKALTFLGPQFFFDCLWPSGWETLKSTYSREEGPISKFQGGPLVPALSGIAQSLSSSESKHESGHVFLRTSPLTRQLEMTFEVSTIHSHQSCYSHPPFCKVLGRKPLILHLDFDLQLVLEKCNQKEKVNAP